MPETTKPEYTKALKRIFREVLPDQQKTCSSHKKDVAIVGRQQSESVFDNLKGGFVTVNGIAEMLKISPKTVYDWVYRKIIPFIKINGALRFSLVEIEKWLSLQKGA